MSDNKPSNSENEEVDLGQLFNAIGKLFDNFFLFLGKILKGLFEVVIYALKPIVNNFKLITIVVLASAIIGYVFQKLETPTYESDMLVRPYFESKYQLANNVNYFNALIKERNIAELSAIFEIDSVEAMNLIGFEMAIGPETANDLLVEYDRYIKSIDSALASGVTYDDFIDNRDILNANIFSITARATVNDVFVGLEKGFAKTFENEYSKRLKEKRDDTINLRKVSLEKQLEEIKNLQDVYVKVIEKESEKPEVSIGTEGMFPLQQTKRETKEFDLLQNELQIRRTINKLDEQLVKTDSYFDILAGFEEVGARSSNIRTNKTFVYPAIVFAILVFSFVFVKCFVFIKNYGE
ncbi:GumC domain-containing protein [Winogradskyella aurantiaca]|uniref:hypothetical protein n=1 Tax=Winogradskyella aurantiaca TaxID=2219558 RepID=UPI000E1C7FE7|nr:hypothetical protein [Winogradskyella aurantiaca]